MARYKLRVAVLVFNNNGIYGGKFEGEPGSKFPDVRKCVGRGGGGVCVCAYEMVCEREGDKGGVVCEREKGGVRARVGVSVSPLSTLYGCTYMSHVQPTYPPTSKNRTPSPRPSCPAPATICWPRRSAGWACTRRRPRSWRRRWTRCVCAFVACVLVACALGRCGALCFVVCVCVCVVGRSFRWIKPPSSLSLSPSPFIDTPLPPSLPPIPFRSFVSTGHRAPGLFPHQHRHRPSLRHGIRLAARPQLDD